jgi:translation initiation factor IF-2
VVLNELSASEVEARRRALQDSRVRDVEDASVLKKKLRAAPKKRPAVRPKRLKTQRPAPRKRPPPPWQADADVLRSTMTAIPVAARVAMRRRQEKMRRGDDAGEREKIAREVTLPETITIQELSQRMAERSVDVIKYLIQEGEMMTIIDADQQNSSPKNSATPSSVSPSPMLKIGLGMLRTMKAI